MLSNIDSLTDYDQSGELDTRFQKLKLIDPDLTYMEYKLEQHYKHFADELIKTLTEINSNKELMSLSYIPSRMASNYEHNDYSQLREELEQKFNEFDGAIISPTVEE